MKKTIIIILIWISLGILFTHVILNKNFFKGKEYMVYAFEIGTYNEEEQAQGVANNLPSSIILKENNLYKVYSGIYKDIDIVNKMVVYFEGKDIDILLKTINTNSNFYNELDNWEKILANTNDEKVYDKVNQGILDRYIESIIL